MLFEEVDAGQLERLHRGADFERKLARDPDEAGVRWCSFASSSRASICSAATLASAFAVCIAIADGLRIGVDRFGGDALREDASAAVDDRAAHRLQRERPLLLPRAL